MSRSPSSRQSQPAVTSITRAPPAEGEETETSPLASSKVLVYSSFGSTSARVLETPPVVVVAVWVGTPAVGPTVLTTVMVVVPPVLLVEASAGAVVPGDLIVLTIGEPIGQAGGTNTMKLVKVGEHRPPKFAQR